MTVLRAAVACLLSGCLLLGALGCCHPSEAHIRLRLEDMAEQAYSTGCYHATIDHCTRLVSLEARDACFSQGLVTCEERAKSFKETLHKGGGAAPSPTGAR